ncbi:MAG: zinc ABC transporter substrate-binding protein [Ruminococcaceae bacterium]|nr:zinc ABC transporter substrate-binding protein [Oscillospiraceae bacterium]
MKKLISLIIIVSSLLSLFACSPVQNGDGISVITTCFPLYDFARELIGEKGSVTLLLKPGQDSHSYDPSLKEIARIKNCDLFISIGGADEKWVMELMSGSDMKNVEQLSLVHLFAEDEHTHNGHSHNDEHFWTSPKNAVLMVKEIAQTLISLFPEEKDYISANLTEYLSKLEALDTAFKEVGELSKGKTVIFGDRFPFTHLFCDYGIEYLSAYPGCSDMTEPSASTVVELINTVKENGIKTVFVTEMSNGALADTICSETGAKKAVLHSCANITKQDKKNGETYISLMTKNAEELKKSLQK